MNVGGGRKCREAVALPIVEHHAGADGGDGVIKNRIVEWGEDVPAGVPDSKVNIDVHGFPPFRDRPALAAAF